MVKGKCQELGNECFAQKRKQPINQSVISELNDT